MRSSTALLFVIATLVTSISNADGTDLLIDGTEQTPTPVPSSSNSDFEKMSDKEANLIKGALADYITIPARDKKTNSTDLKCTVKES